jgi:hypothetical protein
LSSNRVTMDELWPWIEGDDGQVPVYILYLLSSLE